MAILGCDFRMTGFPTILLMAGMMLGLPKAMAGEPKDIAFVARLDGTTQRYVRIDPEHREEDQVTDLLIALHGHGSDRWQFVTADRDECRAVRDVAQRRHMLLVSPDYRARTSWMGPQAEADLVQLIEELKREENIGRVFLCGGSMGGSSALTFTALHPDLISGVAAMNGTTNHLEFQNFQDAIAVSFGGKKAAIPGEDKKRSAEYWPERFTMPVGLTTGGRDKAVPPESVLRLARTLKTLECPVLLVHREQGGHSTTYDDAVRILDFVIQHAR